MLGLKQITSIFDAVAKKADEARDTLKAYHGSPHDFDEFSTEELGSGTGVFGQGKGMYFAENEATARSYRDSLAQMSENNKGHMYKVDINATLDEMLAYEKPLSQQEPAVLEKIKQNLPKIRKTLKLRDDVSDQQLLDNYTGDYLFQRLNTETGGDAVNFLEGIGFKGFRYPDPQTRFSKNPTDNYVVWKDALVNITKKYGLTLPVATAVMSGALTPQEAQAGIGFFSQAVKAAKNLQRKKGNAQSFFNDLVNKGQVKADELNNMGFKEHFGNRTDITKEEVQRFINRNELQIEEIRYQSADDMSDEQLLNWAKENEYDLYENYGYSKRMYDEAGVEFALEDIKKAYKAVEKTPQHRYYTLGQGQDGENYRNILLTLPDDRKSEYASRLDYRKSTMEQKRKIDNDIETVNEMLEFGELTKAEYDEAIKPLRYQEEKLNEQLIKQQKAIDEIEDEYYINPVHYDDPQILTSMRLVDRTDTEGNTGLLIEEIQDDSSKVIREHGYREKGELTKARQASHTLKEEMESLQQSILDIANENFPELRAETLKLKEAREAATKKFDKHLDDKPYTFTTDAESRAWYAREAEIVKELEAARRAHTDARLELMRGVDEKYLEKTGRSYRKDFETASTNYTDSKAIVRALERQAPNRPFKVGTKEQTGGENSPSYELALKRILMEAVENDNPYIYLTRGEDQAARYADQTGLIPLYNDTYVNKLAKLIKRDGGVVDTAYLPSGKKRSVVDINEIDGGSMAEADELLELQRMADDGTLISPSAEERYQYLLDKYSPKQQKHKVHRFSVTDETRERVKKGLPLFTAGGLTFTAGSMFAPQSQAAVNEGYNGVSDEQFQALMDEEARLSADYKQKGISSWGKASPELAKYRRSQILPSLANSGVGLVDDILAAGDFFLHGGLFGKYNRSKTSEPDPRTLQDSAVGKAVDNTVFGDPRDKEAIEESRTMGTYLNPFPHF